MKDRGFISADILFSLLILSLIGIIFIFSLINLLFYRKRMKIGLR